MGIGLVGSDLFRDVYSSSRMEEIFGERGQLQSWLDFEAALARAQARCGVIPAQAAAAISERAVAETIDIPLFRRLAAESLHPIVPLVRLLARACDEPHGRYVHWGATTQDVMDTGLVLQLREAGALLCEQLEALGFGLDRLVSEHGETVMAGRTRAQHAVPITFSYKAAVWLDETTRAIRRLGAAVEDVSVVQFGGAVGTLASLGPDGLRVRSALADELGLNEPVTTWHVARDRLASFAFAVVAVTAVVRRIAAEIIELQRPEIGELEEPFHPGKVGSSTMPHKRNPVLAETAWTLGQLVNEAFSALLPALAPRHERAMELWQLEWDLIPRLCVFAQRALELGNELISGLQIDVARMRENLDLSNGLIFSEAAMMVLADAIGVRAAHDVVYDIAMDSFEHGTPFRTALASDPRTASVLSDADLNRIFAAENLMTSASTMAHAARDTWSAGTDW